MAQQLNANEPFLNVDEEAARLGIKSSTLRMWTRLPGFPAVRLGSKLVRYQHSAVVAWCAAGGPIGVKAKLAALPRDPDHWRRSEQARQAGIASGNARRRKSRIERAQP